MGPAATTITKHQTLGLSLAALSQLDSRVGVPSYQRSDLTAGILHFGVGNFHRAHAAVYLHELFNLGRDRDWAIIGSGVRPEDVRMRSILAAQDFLTTVVEQEATRSRAFVTGPMLDFTAPGETELLLERLANPAIRIVSLTITEGGYYHTSATQKLDDQHPDIIYDSRSPSSPRTVFGLLLAGLSRRRSRGIAPFTVMSCDNIPGNGEVTRSCVAGLAELMDSALARWVRQEVAFPNSMVDRITPATSGRERAALAEELGVQDGWPVFCEDFKQWVLEDEFPSGRPALEEVGVTFVRDVAPYELMKLRVLNGGHAAIAYPAGLLDIELVHEAMEHPLIRAYLRKLEFEEIIPSLGAGVPGVDLNDYFAVVERRFSNPKIGDTVRRLCFDGSNRQPKFILPTVLGRLDQGAPVHGLALVSALWCRYCYGVTESERPVTANDPQWERLKGAAQQARKNPQAFLDLRDIFGALADRDDYVLAFTRALRTVWAEGTAGALQRYLDGAL